MRGSGLESRLADRIRSIELTSTRIAGYLRRVLVEIRQEGFGFIGSFQVRQQQGEEAASVFVLRAHVGLNQEQ